MSSGFDQNIPLIKNHSGFYYVFPSEEFENRTEESEQLSLAMNSNLVRGVMTDLKLTQSTFVRLEKLSFNASLNATPLPTGVSLGTTTKKDKSLTTKEKSSSINKINKKGVDVSQTIKKQIHVVKHSRMSKLSKPERSPEEYLEISKIRKTPYREKKQKRVNKLLTWTKPRQTYCQQKKMFTTEIEEVEDNDWEYATEQTFLKLSNPYNTEVVYNDNLTKNKTKDVIDELSSQYIGPTNPIDKLMKGKKQIKKTRFIKTRNKSLNIKSQISTNALVKIGQPNVFNNLTSKHKTELVLDTSSETYVPTHKTINYPTEIELQQRVTTTNDKAIETFNSLQSKLKSNKRRAGQVEKEIDVRHMKNDQLTASNTCESTAKRKMIKNSLNKVETSNMESSVRSTKCRQNNRRQRPCKRKLKKLTLSKRVDTKSDIIQTVAVPATYNVSKTEEKSKSTSCFSDNTTSESDVEVITISDDETRKLKGTKLSPNIRHEQKILVKEDTSTNNNSKLMKITLVKTKKKKNDSQKDSEKINSDVKKYEVITEGCKSPIKKWKKDWCEKYFNEIGEIGVRNESMATTSISVNNDGKLYRKNDSLQYKCKFCERRYKTEVRMEYHILTHTPNYYPYICDKEGCSKKYKKESPFLQHKQQHEIEKERRNKFKARVEERKRKKEKIYTCMFCEFRSSTRSHAEKHMEVWHNEKYKLSLRTVRAHADALEIQYYRQRLLKEKEIELAPTEEIYKPQIEIITPPPTNQKECAEEEEKIYDQYLCPSCGNLFPDYMGHVCYSSEVNGRNLVTQAFSFTPGGKNVTFTKSPNIYSSTHPMNSMTSTSPLDNYENENDNFYSSSTYTSSNSTNGVISTVYDTSNLLLNVPAIINTPPVHTLESAIEVDDTLYQNIIEKNCRPIVPISANLVSQFDLPLPGTHTQTEFTFQDLLLLEQNLDFTCL